MKRSLISNNFQFSNFTCHLHSNFHSVKLGSHFEDFAVYQRVFSMLSHRHSVTWRYLVKRPVSNLWGMPRNTKYPGPIHRVVCLCQQHISKLKVMICSSEWAIQTLMNFWRSHFLQVQQDQKEKSTKFPQFVLAFPNMNFAEHWEWNFNNLFSNFCRQIAT